MHCNETQGKTGQSGGNDLWHEVAGVVSLSLIVFLRSINQNMLIPSEALGVHHACVRVHVCMFVCVCVHVCAKETENKKNLFV